MPRPLVALLVACFLAFLPACGDLFGRKKLPPPIEYSLLSPYPNGWTVAVAPAINLSGGHDFDPLATSDIIYSELQQVGGLNVLPLNKTLIAMRKLQMRTLDSPEAAQRIMDALGADSLLVPAITAYDPYNPPTVGMVLQLYTLKRAGIVAESMPANRALAVAGSPDEKQPVSQVSAVFNATNQTVLRELRDYAQGRTQYGTALEDQRFLLDADAYTRFVAHAMIRRLLEVERVRTNGR